MLEQKIQQSWTQSLKMTNTIEIDKRKVMKKMREILKLKIKNEYLSHYNKS